MPLWVSSSRSWGSVVPHPQKTHRSRSRTTAGRAADPSSVEQPAAPESAPVGMMPIAASVVRRVILDPAYEDDVYDAEEGKRRAKVADMQGGTIKPNDPRRAVLTEHLLGSGRASGAKEPAGEPGKIGAKDPRKSMLTEHLQGTGRAESLQFGGHDMPSQALGGDRTAPISTHLVESGRASIAFGAQATKEAQSLGTSTVSGGDHSKVASVAGKHPEQVEAKVEAGDGGERRKQRPKNLLEEGPQAHRAPSLRIRRNGPVRRRRSSDQDYVGALALLDGGQERSPGETEERQRRLRQPAATDIQ